jgi:hypothetical protein
MRYVPGVGASIEAVLLSVISVPLLAPMKLGRWLCRDALTTL